MYPTKKLPQILTKDDFSIGKIKTQDYLSEGNFAIVDQGKSLVGGYSTEENLVYTGKLPVIVYGDHTNIVKYIDFPFIGGADGIKVFSFQKDINTKYAFYLLEYFKPETQGYRRHYSLLKDIDLPIPPLSTQSHIVAKLDEAFGNIDKQIVLLKSNIDDVENLAKSILKKIFLEGELVAIEDLVCETKTWNPSIIGEEYFEYIDISSIDNVNYILTDTKTISGIDAPSRAKKLVNPNDIIFATTRPNLKNIAIVDKEIKNLTCSTGFCVLKANENKLFYRYLFYCLISDEMMVCIQPMIRGAQYPAISDKDLKSVQIPLPTLSRQFEIVSLLDALYDKNKQLKSEYEAQIQDLETLKQSLLEEAFAGRLVLDGQ